LSTIFTAPYRGDTLVTKKLMAYSRYGCFDSAIATIHIPPADDYTITINDLECAAKGDSVYASFTICNAYPTGDIPANLKASFYDANPITGSANILGTVFINTTAAAGPCLSYTQLIKQSPSGTIYAVVNDNGTVIPVLLPNNEGILEKNYANNVTNAVYHTPALSVVPSDTTIFRNDMVTLSYSTPMIPPISAVWQPGSSYDLSCTSCTSTLVTPHDSSIVTLEVTSRYGCKVNAVGKVNVFPPDMTVEILNTKCYTNDSTLVSFKICMNNKYGNVFEKIPVSFYEGNSNNGKQLYPVFYTPVITPGGCAVFSQVVASPEADNITAMVNDKGTGNVPAKMYDETDYNNNANSQPFIPFRVSFNPSVIELARLGTIQLLPQVSGGLPSSYQWVWAETLSCRDCASPFATATSTTQYQVKVKNEYNCTDTGTVIIKTFTNTAVNIPTAFTPNADGKNDVFYVIGSRDIKQLKDFSVFNRWGQKVFQVSNVPPNDKSFGWNGTLKGVAASGGGYVYSITVEFTNGKTELFKGVVMLIR
jgi:gliding motility-associated-like protein